MSISAQEFAQRRQNFMAQMLPNSLALLAAAPEVIRNGDSTYLYRQHSDFYYLTGFCEPDAIAVFIPGHSDGEYILFNRPRDAQSEQWDGPRAGQEKAQTEYGAQQAYAIHEIDHILPQLFKNRDHIYLPLLRDTSLLKRIMSILGSAQGHSRGINKIPKNLLDCDAIVHELRLFKSPAEQDLMRRAATISAQAHCRAMQNCRAGSYEYELEAELLYEFARQGSRAPAYSTIVAGGANACTLHYIANQTPLQNGELVLIDAGCEFEHYAADISRTFPVNGRFSADQRALYEIVLRAQLAGIAAIKPGASWDSPQLAIIPIITQGLYDLGILKGDIDQLLTDKAYQRFYVHSYGHWLGLDVHDAGSYRLAEKWRNFEAGMVTTVEPGIYIKPADDIDERWWNIGIRIEDDVLVTATGNEVLSAAAPKSIKAIEQLMAKSC